ncbi:ead/Ea22-like family protein [Pseudomonas capsici]|uniref:ead/Ea22-like family protein n=1 Tax=Pseudomonas capsici TaxID=2810614 RepID=UPI0021F0EEB6|nr:ead/Ea22-like family protein [Pseudomonas capsici]MCV4343299.1 ead/Ea22-like family protein [Pseudomonas capsici]
MTIDKNRLKALAEAATQDHGARRVEVDLNGRNVIGDGSWKIFIAWHTPDGKGKQNAEFCAAASPATILALLGEIDQLKEWQESHRRNYFAVAEERDDLKAENEALRLEREGMALVPVVPAHGLLMSMAIRHNHGLGVPGYYDQPFMQRANHGVSHARMVECALSEMRKLHEEVVGVGFYSLAKDADYAALAKEQSNG